MHNSPRIIYFLWSFNWLALSDSKMTLMSCQSFLIRQNKNYNRFVVVPTIALIADYSKRISFLTKMFFVRTRPFWTDNFHGGTFDLCPIDVRTPKTEVQRSVSTGEQHEKKQQRLQMTGNTRLIPRLHNAICTIGQTDSIKADMIWIAVPSVLWSEGERVAMKMPHQRCNCKQTECCH